MTTTPMATIQSEFTLGTPLSPAMGGLRACADALVYHTVGGRELRPDDLAASVDDDGRKAADAVPESLPEALERGCVDDRDADAVTVALEERVDPVGDA